MTTLHQDLTDYTRALCDPPNAWGQHMVGDIISHAFLRVMYERHGKENVDRALEAYWRALESGK